MTHVHHILTICIVSHVPLAQLFVCIHVSEREKMRAYVLIVKFCLTHAILRVILFTVLLFEFYNVFINNSKSGFLHFCIILNL